MENSEEKKLIEARHAVGIYSINEIRIMFTNPETGKALSRFSLDNAMNEGRLRYISPNNRDRYIYIKDFIALMESQGNGKECDEEVKKESASVSKVLSISQVKIK